MAPFRMCALCQAEYDDPGDRRFHAQPNACPECGPRLTALSADGAPLGWEEPTAQAGAMLREGLVLAVKGLGGFHLACDATSDAAVGRLRRRKRREEKPFAVMVRDLDEAGRLALLGPLERDLLASPERPIVLAPRRSEAALASNVAPESPLVGILLAYTPLHHLLLADTGRPLVMTSGNLSEEPIACANGEAVQRLSGICDGYLVHDREIESRCDDSVVRMVAGGPVLLRRSRGWVPRPVPVAVPFEEPVLACGAHLKNTFCIGLGSSAYLGPHIGDLENLETLTAFEEAVERMERFLRVRPNLVAHDLHPEYVSTLYARRSRARRKIAVQHHFAHVASAMAEHGLRGPVLGLAWDGTGYGTDGTSWGGELLLAGPDGYERLATFRPLRLPGGDTAVREPWRSALALLEEAFPEGAPLDRLPLFDRIDVRAIDVVRQMLATGLNVPLARGVGRYFDAFGSIFLGRGISRYEGQVAVAWNLAADPGERGSYPFSTSGDDFPELDLRPAARAAVEDFLAGASPATISGRFHNTLARAAASQIAAARARASDAPVVLTGGCFQNALLAERVLERLSGSRVFLQRRVPPGDGGLALGQAVVANAIAAKGGP